MSNVPTVEITEEQLGTKLIDVLTESKVFATKSEGRRLIQQNGLTLGDDKVSDIETLLTVDSFKGEKDILVRKGKKKYYKLVLK